MQTPTLRLYSYFRSSCSYRVRIALYYKNLPFEYVPVHLVQDGGQQYKDAYLARNPLAEVPTLEVLDENGQVSATIGQSVAILEYLEECFPAKPMMPKDPVARAKVRQVVEGVNSGIQPIQNLRIMRALQQRYALSPDEPKAWSRHWIEHGFRGLEGVVADTAGAYAVGDHITLADALIVPQCYNARRFGINMDAFPTIQRVAAAAEALPAFQKAEPHVQPDTPPELAASSHTPG